MPWVIGLAELRMMVVACGSAWAAVKASRLAAARRVFFMAILGVG
jgi:hypothetical protein